MPHTDEEIRIDHVQRIVRLEERVNEHGEILTGLVPTVNSIASNLRAIKWACVGAAAVFGIQKLGVMGVLKALIHLAA